MDPHIKNLWSIERTEELKNLWAETTMSISEIGRKFGLSRNAIAGKIYRLGLPHHSNTGNPNPNPKRERPNRIRYKPVVYFAPQKEPDPPAAEFPGITLEDLKTDSCRYPKGTEVPYLFCGQPTKDGSSWCPSCEKKVWVSSKYTPNTYFTFRSRYR